MLVLQWFVVGEEFVVVVIDFEVVVVECHAVVGGVEIVIVLDIVLPDLGIGKLSFMTESAVWVHDHNQRSNKSSR